MVLVDADGLPLAFGDIWAGNHHDLFQVVPQFAKMTRTLKIHGINLENSTLNMDKGFDYQKLRRALLRRKIRPNVKENKRNRKVTKRGRKRYFDENLYKKRFCVERTNAWLLP